MGSSSSAPAVLPWLTVLVLLAGQALGMSPSREYRAVVDKLNERLGLFVVMVMAYGAEAEAVEASGEFVADAETPWVDLYGRRYHVGFIRGLAVISVMCGQRRLNAGITVQTLLDYFYLKGIIHYGTAGSADDVNLTFGDVSVLKEMAFLGSWNWVRYNSTGNNRLTNLSVGEYNTPEKGENLLGRIEFKSEEYFSIGHDMQEVFWLKPDPDWYQEAHKLQNLELDSCANSSYCLPTKPKVVMGLKGATADIFLDNAAYRKFINQRFNISIVDEESAAIAMTAQGLVPVIVIRGVSDLAGGEAGWSSTTLSSLASTNALKVAIEFIELIGKKKAHRRLGVAVA